MDFYIDYLANHHSYVGEIAKLKYDHWHHTSPDRAYPVWVSDIEDSAKIGDFPSTLLALDKSGLLGFVTMIRIDERAGIQDGVWMITLYVKSEHRRRGIGTRLIDRCIAEARKLGIDTLYLWTEAEELTRYYASRGWQLQGTDQDGEDIMFFKVR